jgi:murein DD-endopeptidase MepM/ murein hydrolase activator NlpD
MAIIKNGTAKVQSGDTLSAIAKKAGTTVAAIAKINNIPNVNLIKPGQVFTLPTKANQTIQTDSSASRTSGGFNEGPDAARAAAEAAAKAEADRLAAIEAAKQQAIQAAIDAERNRIAALGTGTSSQLSSLQTRIAQLEAEAAASAAATAASLAATTAATTATTSAMTTARQSIMTILEERFARYGLSSLATKIKELAIDGATEATISIQLAETEEYKTRFKANTERVKKGLTVLSPAEYLTLEDGYRQILRSYGLKQFDTDEYVSQFIANDVAPAELSTRVVTAVQRVQNADPAVSRTLRDYYGVGQADLVGYVLDPTNQLQKIERQVAAAEIGTAARVQGLETGVGVAEQLAAQGITAAQAQKGYATIADILPTAEKLSQIYGTTTGTYGQSQAEQEVFNSLASAQRARQRLTEREIAAFSGKSGLAKTSLSTNTAGQI